MSKGSYLYVSVALSPPLKLQLQLYLNLFHPLFWATAALISAKDTLSPLPCFLWFPPGFHIWEQAFTFPFPGTRLICDLVLPSALVTNKQPPKPIAYWWFPPGRPSRSQRSFFNTLLWRRGLCWAAWSTSALRKGTGLRQQQQLSEEERKGLRRQKGTIALKYPDLSQNTHRGVKKKNKASFGSSPAQNDNVLVCPPESRTKEASSPGGWHRGMLPMQSFDVKFKVLKRVSSLPIFTKWTTNSSTGFKDYYTGHAMEWLKHGECHHLFV